MPCPGTRCERATTCSRLLPIPASGRRASFTQQQRRRPTYVCLRAFRSLEATGVGCAARPSSSRICSYFFFVWRNPPIMSSSIRVHVLYHPRIVRFSNPQNSENLPSRGGVILRASPRPHLHLPKRYTTAYTHGLLYSYTRPDSVHAAHRSTLPRPTGRPRCRLGRWTPRRAAPPPRRPRIPSRPERGCWPLGKLQDRPIVFRPGDAARSARVKYCWRWCGDWVLMSRGFLGGTGCAPRGCQRK